MPRRNEPEPLAATDTRGDEESPALLAEGFAEAFLGLGTQFNTEVALYDYERCVQILMERDGLSYEEAVEHLEFNVTGAYVGPHTPVFLRQTRETLEGFSHP